jgi:hypothetical protein
LRSRAAPASTPAAPARWLMRAAATSTLW